VCRDPENSARLNGITYEGNQGNVYSKGLEWKRQESMGSQMELAWGLSNRGNPSGT
jgi:hypothetical protein